MASLLIQQAYGDGVTKAFPFTFPYITVKDIIVSIDGEDEGSWVLSEDGTTVVLNWPPATGALVTVERYTDMQPLVAFQGTAILLNSSLNLSQLQTTHIAETASDLANATILFNPRLNVYDAKGFRIAHVGLCLTDFDVATKAYLSQALANIHYVRPSDAALAAALLAMAAIIASMAPDQYAIYSITPPGLRDRATYDEFHMRLVIETLNALNLNPPPPAATIVARLDAYFGSIVWRTAVTGEDTGTTDFDASGTWTKPVHGTFALVEVWAAGGAGYSFNQANRWYGSGGSCTVNQPGGGGGGYSRKLFWLEDLSATVAVGVGLGGVPSYAYSDSGRNGGNSNFGGYLAAYGGWGPQNPYSGGGGGGPIDGPSGWFPTAQGITGGAQHGAGPRVTYPVSLGYQLGFAAPNIHAFAVAQTGLLAQGDGAYKLPLTGYNVPGLPAQPGIQHGGGGGSPSTRGGANGTIMNDGIAIVLQGMNGGYSVHGGGGGGSGLTIPTMPGIQVSFIIGRPPGSAGFLNGTYTSPTLFPNGLGGLSTNGGRGGDGGTTGQNGQDGAVPGGGGGGAGLAVGNYNLVNAGPIGGHGGHGRVRVTVW